jgi:hypothetical protein
MAPAQARRNFARRKPTRKAKDTVLIVCEGEKTEPNYFEELKRDLGLSNMDIVIYGKECDSDPMSVVRHALAECKKADHGFDYVFCVVDRDAHTQFLPAVATCEKAKPLGNKQFVLAWSEPCFEYWFLLHYAYSSKPYSAKGSSSIGAVCVQELCNKMSDYAKGARGTYAVVKGKIDFAILNAKRRLCECEEQGGTNPSTRVHFVVERLRQIAKDAEPNS